jgi:type III pantothenate kinase
MSAARLTVDVGNSSAKLRLWRPDGDGPLAAPTAALAVERAGDAALGDFLAAVPPGTRCGLCAVGSRELEQALAALLAARLGEPSVVRPDPGVANACRDPHTTGRDRLFAARGAHELLARAGRVGRGFLVVDAGTALTVDAVEAAESGPRFLGGAIAPGPRLLARALAGGTHRLPDVAPEERAPALGRDTREAIRAGVSAGFRGAARELVARVGAEAGLAEAVVVVTGGARGFLVEPGTAAEFGGHPLLVDAELVHRGLLAALGEAP